MKLSVIVAAYNEEKNIHRCLDSLVHQTMRDGLEIIVVNDGSIDKTAEICDKYAEEYDFLKVLHTTNNGQGMARNRGIEEATGDYIGFVDADDWVEIDMFEHLYEEAVIHDSDMVVCDVHKIFDDEQREEDVISLPEPASSIDIGTYLAYGENNAYSWNKIYRRELWQEYHYEKMVYEDLALIPIIICHCQKISYVQESLYNYFKHSHTTTSSYKNPRLFDIFIAYEKLMQAQTEYKDFIVYNVAKRLLCNMRTAGFKYYFAECIEFINRYTEVFLSNELVKKDSAVCSIYDYIGMQTIPNRLIHLRSVSIDSFKRYTRHYEDVICDSYEEMFRQAFEGGGLIINDELELSAPYGYLRATHSFVVNEGKGCISTKLMGFVKESESIGYIADCLKKKDNIDEQKLKNVEIIMDY